MEIFRLPLGPLQTNCYILPGEDGRCLAIDPGDEPEKVLAFLEGKGLTLDSILLTHGHFDHVGAVKELAAETGCRVFLCQEDLALPPAITAGTLSCTDTYAEGDSLCLAGLPFAVLHTPGHTPGSVCLRFADCLFSGDTLFEGSCGRTDLPGGNGKQMRDSLNRLAALEGNCAIYPGHGGATTLDEEKRYNYYLR